MTGRCYEGYWPVPCRPGCPHDTPEPPRLDTDAIAAEIDRLLTRAVEERAR